MLLKTLHFSLCICMITCQIKMSTLLGTPVLSFFKVHMYVFKNDTGTQTQLVIRYGLINHNVIANHPFCSFTSMQISSCLSCLLKSILNLTVLNCKYAFCYLHKIAVQRVYLIMWPLTLYVENEVLHLDFPFDFL